MKTIMTIAITLLFALLVGCSNQTTTPDIIQPIWFQVDEINTVEPGVPGMIAAFTRISVKENAKEDIINEIDISRSTSRNTEEICIDKNYEASRISEITEFYFPNIEINGFELHSVVVSDATFWFFYVPIGFRDDFHQLLLDGGEGFIRISITRPEWYAVRGIDSFQASVAQGRGQGWGELTEDGMLYDHEFGNISFRMGNAVVMIEEFDKVHEYEFLRDLAWQVQKSAELVDVEKELDVMRRSRE